MYSQYPPNHPYYTGRRNEMNMPMMDMEQMKQMMMEHMMVTQQIKQTVDSIDERLATMERMMMKGR